LQIGRGRISPVTDGCGSESGGEEIHGEEEMIYFINIDLEVDDIDGEEETGKDHGNCYDDDADDGKTGLSYQGNSNYDLLITLEEGAGPPTLVAGEHAGEERQGAGGRPQERSLSLGDPGQVQYRAGLWRPSPRTMCALS
jgi:hypothetical protein